VDGGDFRYQVRCEAEPALDAWVAELLPDPADVACLATYGWTVGETSTAISDDSDGPGAHRHEVERTVTLGELDLGPLDVLYLGGDAERPGRSELEERLAYFLRRDRPANDPPIPGDATVELSVTETGRDDATPVADLLEVVRSLRTLVLDGRPVDATDLAHPEAAPDPGYTRASVDELRERGDTAETALASVGAALENRLAVLDPPGGDEPLLAQLDAVLRTAETFVEDVPVDSVIDLPAFLDGDLERELDSLVSWLEERPREYAPADEHVRVQAGPEQRLSDRLRPSDAISIVPGSVVHSEGATADGASLPQSVTDRRRYLETLGAVEGFDSLLVESRPANDGGRGSEETADGVDPTASSADTDGGADRSTETDPGESLPERFVDVELDVVVWSTTPTVWFERTATTTTDENGAFTVSVDFSAVEPGTSFAVVGVVDGEVAYAERGRVLGDAVGAPSDRDGTVTDTLPESASVLPWLLWLDRERRRLSVSDETETPAGSLDAAIDATPWQAARRERSLFDPTWMTVSAAELAETDALLDLADVDLTVVEDAVASVLDVVHRTGVSTTFGLAGDAGGTGAPEVTVRRPESEVAVRNRAERYLDNPVAYNRDAADSVLGFAPAAALAIDATDDPTRLAGYLHVLLNQPGAFVRYLGEHTAEPHCLLADLWRWLYGSAADRTTTDDPGEAIGELVDAVAEMDRLEILFEIFERERVVAGGEPETVVSHRTSVTRLLGQVQEELLGESPPRVPDAPTERDEAANAFAGAVSDVATAVSAHVSPVRVVAGHDATTSGAPTATDDGPAPAVDAATAFRHGVMETVRLPLVRASYFGVYGSTPQSADGGTPADGAALRSQARVVADRVTARLDEAAGAVSANERSIETSVAAQRTRIRAVFGEQFVVLAPFVPTNGPELVRTFGNDGLLDAGSSLAPETWLQRNAQVRERPADFREAISYVEALTGMLVRDLAVGQLPHRPEDDWVGIDGINPRPGQLSLVAQFGLDFRVPDLTRTVRGVFVDEHVERVPSDEVTTGLAINYDDPGNRAPQSILLAVPPADGEWSIDVLESTVRETMRLSKFRAVDLADLPDFGHFLPMLSFAYNTGSPPETPSIDFESLGVADSLVSTAVASSYTVFTDYDVPFDGPDGESR
ncbi:MAG: hypothetical protein V5A16_03690, partial [Haloplanus sp.]